VKKTAAAKIQKSFDVAGFYNEAGRAVMRGPVSASFDRRP
jgi:hypothetical protein